MLFLLAIFVTCQANKVSRSRQLNAYPGHRKNDLNQRAYLDEEGSRSDRSIGRTAYDGSVHVVRIRDLNDDVGLAGNPSHSDIVMNPSTLVVGKLPTRSSQTSNAWRVGPNKGSDVARTSSQDQAVPDKNHKATLTRAYKIDKDPFVWNRARVDDAVSDGHVVRKTRSLPLGTSDVNQATFVRTTNNLGQGANVLRSSDLNRVRIYGHENYLNRADGLSQADYARRNLVSSVPVARAGNYLNKLDGVGQGLNVERTSYFDRSAPTMRAENYGSYKPKPDVTKSEPKKYISSTDSKRTVAQKSRHGYSHPDPEIERKQREQYVPSLINVAERSAIKDGDNTKGINLPGSDLNDEYSLLSVTYGNPNDGYDAPYDGYRINDGSEMSNQVSYNGYGDMDHNMLAPDFDSFRESGVNSITKNTITNSALIAVYNDDSTDQNIYNNTDQKMISDRGGFFDDDVSYTMDHHAFHNTGTFSDDSTKNNGIPDVVKIVSNSAPLNSNGECYCSTNNGHRACNCDSNHCEDANCHLVTNQMQTTTATTCELCKARETTTPKHFVCDICTQPPPPLPPPPSPLPPTPTCECNCEPCRHKCDPCKQRESSCECKQSCSCGCSSCCKSESSCCKLSCHSCKPNRNSCNNCESGQEFGSNYGENGNNYHEENGIIYYGGNGNNHYGDDGNNAYNEYYKNYYKNQAAAAAAFGGSAGGQFHANEQGNAWTGAYGDEGGQITDRGKSATEQSGTSGGTIVFYADTDLDDVPISDSNSNSAVSSLSSVAASSNSKSSGGSSFKIRGGSVKISGGSIKTIGGKSSSSAGAFGGIAAYGGGGGNPYNNIFSSFSKTGIFPSNSMIGPFGR